MVDKLNYLNKFFSISSESERRVHDRMKIYIGEKFDVLVLSNNHSIRGEIIDLTPFGVGVALDIEEDKKISEGDFVNLKIHGDKEYNLHGVVSNKKNKILVGKNFLKIGIKFLEENEADLKNNYNDLFHCNENIKPTVVAENHLFFQSTNFFTVDRFFYNGAILKSFSNNIVLFKDQIINSLLIVPLVGEYNVFLKVNSIKNSANSELCEIFVEYIDPNHMLLEAISKYLLLTNSNITIRLLKDAGFYVGSVASTLVFDYAKTDEDMMEILNLRLIAHKSWGRFQDVNDPLHMLEKYDEYARHIVFKMNDKIIACTRLIFVNGDSSKSDIARLTNIPDFILKNGFMEFTRICTHPNYRGNDVFITLMQNVARIGVQSGIRYVISSSVDSLWPVYKKMGVKKFGNPIDNPLQPGQKLNFVYLDANEFMVGKGANFLVWHKAFLPVLRFVYKRKSAKLTMYRRFILLLHSFFSPLFELIYIIKVNTEFKKYKRNLKKDL